MRRYVPVWTLMVIASLPILATATAEDKPAVVVAATEAKNHIDEQCTVEMTVRASKNAAPRKEYYLDSEEDFRDEKNFAVVISYDHADQFKAAGISDPAEHFKDKTIRVTGKIIRENDQVRIRVVEPSQIKVVEPGK